MKTPEARSADREAKIIANMGAPRPGLTPENRRAAVDRGSVDIAERMPIAEIDIKDRHRKDLGDLQVLADSIAKVGLLHPPVVSTDGKLIAGARRIRAAQLLGWTDIPVRRIPLADIVRGEYAENAVRKDFTPSEAVAIAKAIKPLEQQAAKERQIAAHASPGKLPEQAKGDVRDRLAASVGLSGRTLEKAEAVVKSGRKDLVEEMDRTGKVDPVFRKLQQPRVSAKTKKPAATVTLILQHTHAELLLRIVKKAKPTSTTQSAIIKDLARAIKKKL